MDAFMGTILAVGFNYPPRGWLFCNGQTIPIQQNSAMFALLGTMYGGDGVNTFGLPDLRGRVVVGSQGAGPGINNVAQGEKAGTNNVTVISNGTASFSLTAANLPAHTHPATLSLSGLSGTTTIDVSTAASGVTTVAAGNTLSQATTGPGSAAIFTASPTGTVALGGVSTAITGNGSVTVEPNTGGTQPVMAPVVTQAQVSVMQPYTGLNYIIAMEGIFPSRN